MNAAQKYAPGTKILWRAHGGDFPATIVKCLGSSPNGNNELYYVIDCPLQPGSGGGIPESQIILDPPPLPSANGNGNHATDKVDFQGMADEALIPPDPLDMWTPGKVCAHVEAMAGYEGHAKQIALDSLRGMVAYLDNTQRKDIRAALLKHKVFKREKDAQAYIDSCPQPPEADRFTPLTLDELLSRPAKVWLIDQVIGAGDLGMIFGPAGSKKTFLTIDLSLSASLGRQWARRFDIPRPLNVTYCAGEGLSGLPSRFMAAVNYYNPAWPINNFQFFELMPQLFDAGDNIAKFTAERLAHQAAGVEQPIDLLILDTLHSAIVGAEENSSKDTGTVLQAIKDAQRALGCAVLLIHHSNKAGTGERGSSALRGAMDVMIELELSGTKTVMKCAKLKDGQQWKLQTFDLVEVADCESPRVWWDEPIDSDEGDKRKSETAREILQILFDAGDNKLTSKQIGEAIDSKPQTINKVLARLAKEELVTRDQNKRGTWCYGITDEGRDALKGNEPI